MQEQLWRQYYDQLAKGIDIGYSPELEQYSPQLAHSLKYDIAKFSAFKETAFSKQLESALTKNGKIVPWSDFKKEAQRVSGLYNVNYLKTEYHHTVATANMAGKWDGFQQNKDLYPNLRYDAVNDDRTRKKHKEWDGLVAPIDHPIWKIIYPPNDWGCRCGVTQTDEPVSADLPSPNIKKTFKNNAAISGKIFNDVPYKAGLSNSDKKDALIFTMSMFNKESNNLRLEHYNNIVFKKVPNIKNKGILEIFTTGKQNKRELAQNKIALTVLANNEMKYRLLPVINDGFTNPDAYNLIKKHFVDVKVVTTPNGKSALQNALKSASKQEAAEVVLHLTTKPDSYRGMYSVLRETLVKNRNKNVAYMTVIFHNGAVKAYNLKTLKSKLIDKGKTNN